MDSGDHQVLLHQEEQLVWPEVDVTETKGLSIFEMAVQDTLKRIGKQFKRLIQEKIC